MKLIDVTCPKCKAVMKVDKSKKELTCEFCGNKILIDDEVKKVKILHTGQITEEQEFNNAEANLKFKDYIKAYYGYKRLSMRYADNKEVWLGLLRSATEDFTKKEYNPEYEEYFNKYESLAEEKELSKYKTKYDKYMSTFSEKDKKEAIKKLKKLNRSNVWIVFVPVVMVIIIGFIVFGGVFSMIRSNIKNDPTNKYYPTDIFKTTEKLKTKEEYQTEIDNLQSQIDQEFNTIKDEYNKLKEEVKPTKDKIDDLKLKQNKEFRKNGFSKKYNDYENQINDLEDSIADKEGSISRYKSCIENKHCYFGTSSAMKKYDSLVDKKDKLEDEMNEKYN